MKFLVNKISKFRKYTVHYTLEFSDWFCTFERFILTLILFTVCATKIIKTINTKMTNNLSSVIFKFQIQKL